MSTLATRVDWLESHVDNDSGVRNRPLRVGLVRRLMSVRRSARRVQHSPPCSADPAAA